jgi:hypothetical protein
VVLGGVLNKRAATFWVLREVLPKSWWDRPPKIGRNQSKDNVFLTHNI